MTLRIILTWTSASKAKKITNYAIIAIVIFNIADFILMIIIIPIFIPDGEKTWVVTYDAVINGLLLMIVYAVVLYFLM